MFCSPVERDAASFFLSNNPSYIKDMFTGFVLSHDHTDVELTCRKKYNILKQKLQEKEGAGESGWKIRNGKAGPYFFSWGNDRVIYLFSIQTQTVCLRKMINSKP